MKNLFSFYLLLLFSCLNASDVLLPPPPFSEDLCTESILDTKQIQIPNYPKAYNPSLIAYKGGYLLSFRYTKRAPMKSAYRTDSSFIGLAKLDADFNFLPEPIYLLDILSYSAQLSSTAEDARLLKMGERVFIFFNDLPYFQPNGQFALYFGELIEKKGMFVFKEPPKPLYYAEATPTEKNWSPFTKEGRLFLIYSDNPRIILELNPSTGICTKVSEAKWSCDWGWGVVRGGTPAYLVDDQFLTFFHSVDFLHSEHRLRRYYFIGAYTFEQEYPYSIQGITPGPLGTDQYYQLNNRKRVVFPGGLVVQDETIHVAWGKNDNRIFITSFDKKKLLDSMKRPF